MEKEVSAMVSLGANLALLAAFIGIVVFTVFYGNTLRSEAYAKADDLNIQLQTSAISELRDCENEMPVASAYNILNAYGNAVGKTVCKLNDFHEDGSNIEFTEKGPGTCLSQHITGRCKLQVEYDSALSTYVVTIHKDTCEDPYDACTCGG